MKRILPIILIGFALMNLEDSQFHYIDQIDSIRELEFLYNESLNMGDTLKSISVLMDIVTKVEPSSYYSDEFISNYYYKSALF